MTPIIRTEHLSRRFGANQAIHDLSFEVPEGSIFALLGRSGAGKTTAIKMLMNILEPTSGTSEVLGRPSAKLGPAEFQQIGYVSENQELPEWMTMAEFLAYCRPFYPTWDEKFCADLVGQFQLPLDRKLKHLSRGMKMKAALLSSLVYRPRLLVLDEPFSGLDPLSRDEFISGMLALAGESDWTIFISSHDIEEVERLVDWVGFLEEGSLRVCEPVARLRERFRSVEAALEGTASAGPAGLPSHWLSLETNGHALRFVDSEYEPAAFESQLREVYPQAREIQAFPMSLREIFVALARNPRPRMLTPL